MRHMTPAAKLLTLVCLRLVLFHFAKAQSRELVGSIWNETIRCNESNDNLHNGTTGGTSFTSINDPGPWRPPEYRILVHCLQSSGCSYFMAILSQSPAVVTAIDVAVNQKYSIPRSYKNVLVRGPDAIRIVVAKVVVWGIRQIDPVRRLIELKKALRPHATILLLRNPEDNFLSLQKHVVGRKGGPGYAMSKGSPSDKLKALEKLFKTNMSLFNATIYYGDLFYARAEVVESLQALDLPIEHCNFCNPNNLRDIVLFSKAYLKYDARWGAGGITALTPAAQYKLGHRNKGSSNKVHGFCPEVARFATARDKELLHSEALNTNRSFNQVEDLITSEFLKWCKIGQCSQQKPHIPPKPSQEDQRDPSKVGIDLDCRAAL